MRSKFLWLGGVTRFTHLTDILAGGLVIDNASATTPPHDRVFVIMGTPNSATRAYEDTVALAKFKFGRARDIFTINGRSWPSTERIHASVGDSLHWRVISASWEPHPMHLHGFYYRVDDFSGPETDRYGQPSKGQMVVTAFMSGFSTMSMTWSPNRPGNWLFHCHFGVHVRPDSVLAAPDDPHERMMVGLALGTMVSARPGVVAAGDPAAARHLRLIGEIDHPERIIPFTFERAAGTIDSVPNMHFVLEEDGRRIDPHTDLSPELDLVRGELVWITIVNHLPEPTTVHWHGIEVQDSYDARALAAGGERRIRFIRNATPRAGAAGDQHRRDVRLRVHARRDGLISARGLESRAARIAISAQAADHGADSCGVKPQLYSPTPRLGSLLMSGRFPVIDPMPGAMKRRQG